MRHDIVIKHLRIAEAIDCCEMYVSHCDNSMKFGFRLADGLQQLSREDADKFEGDINQATLSIREKWRNKFERYAARAFEARRAGIDT